NEGWIWLAVAAAAVALRLVRAARRGETTLSNALASCAVFTGVALAISLPWPLFLAVRGTVRYVYLPISLPTLTANASRAPRIAWEMARRIPSTYWNGAFLLAGLALLARGRRALAAKDGWVIVPAGLFLVVASGTFVLSRFDPWTAHLRNSADRLMLQALPLAIWFLAAQAADAGVFSRGDRDPARAAPPPAG
ncbi:MAG TPA: hypothetical protein VKF32_12615, partial [Thermoanaerobaculia bacterium]|nr:hypothetical protein [Thermoanaerobaculia bacterium]